MNTIELENVRTPATTGMPGSFRRDFQVSSRSYVTGLALPEHQRQLPLPQHPA
jgi:hypothetical protein